MQEDKLTKEAKPRLTTMKNLVLATAAITQCNRKDETDNTTWKNVRRKLIHLKVQQFLYNAIHGTYHAHNAPA